MQRFLFCVDLRRTTLGVVWMDQVGEAGGRQAREEAMEGSRRRVPKPGLRQALRHRKLCIDV